MDFDDSSPLKEQRLLGLALRQLRKRRGYSQEAAAAEAGISEKTWGRYERGDRGITLATYIEMAGHIGYDRDTFMAARLAAGAGGGFKMIAPTGPQLATLNAPQARAFAPPAANDSGLPIRDRIMAGAWMLADDSVQFFKTYPAIRDPRYPRAAQWVSEVFGDSMNRRNILEGDFVHLVDAIDIGYHPRTEDIVEVERLRNGGQERELTLKEVEVLADGIRLWPRSTNERWTEPLDIRDGVEGDGEDVEVRIRSLMVGLHRRY